MNLQQLAELGYATGLNTLGEAALCAELHWDAWPPGAFEELNREIEEAVNEGIGNDMLCVHFLGAERCAQMDAELDAYFEQSRAQHEGDEPGDPFP